MLGLLRDMHQKGVSVSIKDAPIDGAVIAITMCMNHHYMVKYLNLDVCLDSAMDATNYVYGALACMYKEFLADYEKKKEFADYVIHCEKPEEVVSILSDDILAPELPTSKKTKPKDKNRGGEGSWSNPPRFNSLDEMALYYK